MKETIKKIVKTILKCFYVFPIRKNKIFFMSFDGTKYGYDSKALVEYIDEHEHGKWKMVWGIKCKDEFHHDDSEIENLLFVKIKSLQGIYHMMTAGTLFYNINPPSYIPFRKKQILFNTWHSISYKKVGRYIGEKNEDQVNITTYYLSHAEKFTEWVIRDSFRYHGEVVPCGVPRNDVFFSKKCKAISESVRTKLGINCDMKVMLFAPTFRNNFEKQEDSLDVERVRLALKNKFGGDWVILYRLHPLLAQKYKLNYKGIIDVSLFPDMQELLCATDIFISDYSGGMWDFALTKRPVFIFAEDICEYESSRGLYMNCFELPFPVSKNNDELEKNIMDYSYQKYASNLKKYFENMGSYENGIASGTVLEMIHRTHNIW